MKIISHRGYWKIPAEKNSLVAFDRSFRSGFGTETDFRDHDGRLVIAHDLPGKGAMPAEDFFSALQALGPGLPIAVNIKADGLQKLLQQMLLQFQVRSYFLFDMSVPDAIFSLQHGLRVFTRQSDVEPVPAFYGAAAGVWMDSFFDEGWLSVDRIAAHLSADKDVCLVSPELHRRPHQVFWDKLRLNPARESDRLILCTDFPEEAANYFAK